MSYANPDGTRCFPGVERLAADMGRGRKAIFRYLTELETAGLIRRHSGRKGSEFATNTYRIQLPIPTIPAPHCFLLPVEDLHSAILPHGMQQLAPEN